MPGSGVKSEALSSLLETSPLFKCTTVASLCLGSESPGPTVSYWPVPYPVTGVMRCFWAVLLLLALAVLLLAGIMHVDIGLFMP